MKVQKNQFFFGLGLTRAGKCIPDSSIMLELCNILDVTVNELLSGERIEMNNYEEKVSENLIELKRKDENNMNKIK